MPRKANPILDLTAAPIEKDERYEILKKIGLPIPLRPTTKYPFDKLRVGDGFRIPSQKAKTVGVSARQYSIRHHVTILVRKDPNHPGKHIVVRSA
jgi:hypothetical protein